MAFLFDAVSALVRGECLCSQIPRARSAAQSSLASVHAVFFPLPRDPAAKGTDSSCKPSIGMSCWGGDSGPGPKPQSRSFMLAEGQRLLCLERGGDKDLPPLLKLCKRLWGPIPARKEPVELGPGYF